MAGTQWVRVDVGYLRTPKVQPVGLNGAPLHLPAILYLGEHRIDSGLLPPEALPFVALDAGVRRTEPVIADLVECGLWHPSTKGGFVIHDYSETNGSASEASAARDRKRRWRERGTQDGHA